MHRPKRIIRPFYMVHKQEETGQREGNCDQLADGQPDSDGQLIHQPSACLPEN